MTCREGQYGSSEKICNIGAREGCATDPRVKTADFARKTARKAPNIACSELASHDVADFFGGAIAIPTPKSKRLLDKVAAIFKFSRAISAFCRQSPVPRMQ